MTSAINSTILRLTKRAETSARDKLVRTFVDVGPLFSLLSGKDHQILYGRRGTGKTHVFNYLADNKENEGDAVVIIDLRNIGSSAGLYADGTIPLAERATRLLVDTLLAVHDSLYEFFVEFTEVLDLSHTGPALDRLADAITQVKVVGTSEEVDVESSKQSQKNDAKATLNLSKSPSASFNASSSDSNEMARSITRSRSGTEQLYVNFGTSSSAFRNIVSCLGKRQLWVLLDEWSSIPITLQPYLADLIRRTLFPVQGITIKIAAIEHRSEFMIHKESGEYIGIEVGADASADANLDDFMVFDNDSEKSQLFFENLLTQHIIAETSDGNSQGILKDGKSMIQSVFTEKRSFEEYVRASEGIPRDAINLISLAAQKAIDSKISMQNIRVGAKNWYQRDKEQVVSSNEMAFSLLQWIVDRVIGRRKARAFLLEANKSDALINTLYDSRVVHILKRGISTNDEPGVRYDVYKLDYGCYVDLLNTTKAPQGLLPFDGEDACDFVEVPPDDYRSIRRAILKLDEFYAAHQS